MIRQALETAYRRTIGTVQDALAGLVSSLTRGGGLMQALYVLLVVALTAGFVNAVFFPVLYQNEIPYTTSAGGESIAEAVVGGFVIGVGGMGIYMVYLSGRQTTRTRTVNLYLGLALLLLIVSVFTGIDMAIMKGF